MGVRRLGWRLGNEDTTSGSSRDFSVRSIAATNSFEAREKVGAENTRTASALQRGQGTESVAWPIGRLISTTPCRSQQYSYQAKSHPRCRTAEQTPLTRLDGTTPRYTTGAHSCQFRDLLLIDDS